jgi:3-(3-hydroxy-phenyl)propionate hydroxylase
VTPLPAEVDVLVVGYGPVGAALASLLGQYGVRTLVIDRASEIWMAPRAIALDNEALRILQLAGLSDDAFARVPIPYVRMRCPDLREFARIDTAGTIDGHPKLVTFYQPELERALRRQATAHASVTAAGGVELQGFAQTDGHVVARLGTGAGARTVRARFMVGADGASSTVRAAIGQAFAGETYAEDWLVVDARDVPRSIDHVEFLCDHRRPTPHMVAPGGRTRWEFMLRPGETRDEMERDETIRRLIAPWTDGREIEIERKAVYRFHARSCARYREGRVFLAGDAAHLTPPFAGQGLVAGLRDAANLAWKLAWVVRGRASSAILDSYDEERRPHAIKMIAMAKLLGRVIMPRDRLAAVLVHGALKVARRLPVVRSYVEGLGIKPKPRFAHGLFVRGGRGPLRRGGMFPQRERSDDALGPAVALVGLGADAASRLDQPLRARWAAAGGGVARLAPGGFARPGWCAVVRPDRTVLHDGPAADAPRIVRESLAILGAA